MTKATVKSLLMTAAMSGPVDRCHHNAFRLYPQHQYGRYQPHPCPRALFLIQL
jgi:hypothetical protein